MKFISFTRIIAAFNTLLDLLAPRSAIKNITKKKEKTSAKHTARRASFPRGLHN